MQPFSPESVSTENPPRVLCSSCRAKDTAPSKAGWTKAEPAWLCSLAVPTPRAWMLPRSCVTGKDHQPEQVSAEICAVKSFAASQWPGKLMFFHIISSGALRKHKTCPTTPGVLVFNCKESSPASWGGCIQVAEKEEKYFDFPFYKH